MSGPIEANFVEHVLVNINHFVNAVDLRVKDVAVQRKAVRGNMSSWRERCTKTKYWDLLVRIVELKDVAHGANCVQIFITFYSASLQGFKPKAYGGRNSGVKLGREARGSKV